jgi:hypothetical protein
MMMNRISNILNPKLLLAGIFLCCLFFANTVNANNTAKSTELNKNAPLSTSLDMNRAKEVRSKSLTLSVSPNAFTYSNLATVTQFICPPAISGNCPTIPSPYPDVAAFIAAGGTATTTNSWVSLTSMDVSMGGPCPAAYTITRTYTAMDNGGNPNTASCPQTISMGASLPVELIDVKLVQLKEGLELSWATASEANNRGFEVQRSRTGNDWEMIEFLDGQGTSSTINEYIYLDDHPVIGLNYYRLKQIDWDGVFEYSPVKAGVWQTNSDKDQMRLFLSPNPASSRITAVIPAKFSQDNNLTLQIHNSLGQLIRKESRIGEELNIDLSDLPEGLYILSITQEYLQSLATFTIK